MSYKIELRTDIVLEKITSDRITSSGFVYIGTGQHFDNKVPGGIYDYYICDVADNTRTIILKLFWNELELTYCNVDSDIENIDEILGYFLGKIHV